MTSENQGWNILPYEMKLEVFKYLETKERIKFAKLSYQCFEEIVYEKTANRLHLEKYSESSTDLRFDYSTGFLMLKFTQHGRVCKVSCHFYSSKQKYSNREGRFDLITLGNHKTMAYDMFERCLKNSKSNLQIIEIHDVDFMIRDKSIDEFPKLRDLWIETCDSEELFWFLRRAKNIEDLVLNFRQLNKLENQKLVNLPEDFKLSLDLLIMTSNDANVALKIVNMIEKPKDGWKVSFIIHDEEFAGFDERLMNIFNKTKWFETNVLLTNEQFLELTTKTDLHCDAKNIDVNTIIDVMLNNPREKDGHKDLRFSNVDKRVLDFKSRVEFLPSKISETIFFSPFCGFSASTQDLWSRSSEDVSSEEESDEEEEYDEE